MAAMFEITVRTTFNATHAIVVGGQREPVHGHDWEVLATIAGPTLDDEHLLCDFHAVEAALQAIVDPWRHAHLNDAAAFAELEPTAERVAEAIASRLADALEGVLPTDAAVSAVRVTEAPGCVATYLP